MKNMKFVISHPALSTLLSKLQNVVATKVTIPILANFLIEAKGSEVIITATDLTVGMRCVVDAEVLVEGASTVPARRFASLIRELTAPQLEIAAQANECTEIIANTSRFKLHGLSRKDFPSLPDLSGALSFKISQAQLKEMFYRTAFAVSREDNRYVLTGVCIQLANGTVKFVGTDGKRLAQVQTAVDVDPKAKGEYIVPLKAVEEMLKSLQDKGEATVYLLNDKIAIEANRSLIVTKLLSGEYPDTDRVIPTSHQVELFLHREELMTLLRQISLFLVDSSEAVLFTLSPGELKLSSQAMEIGEGKVGMPMNYQGDLLNIAFNPGYFLDILRHCKGEIVKLQLTDPYSPGVLTEGETTVGQRPNPLFVIMPMRYSDE